MISDRQQYLVNLLSTAIIINLIVVGGNFNGRKVINGRYTRSIANYELTVPKKIDKTGNYISYNLVSYFCSDNQAYNRNRRDFSHPDVVHYKIYFNSENYFIELLPNLNLLSPTISREHYFGGKSRMRTETRSSCHYIGHVRGIEGSRVALSTCNGIVGYIDLASYGKFFIEPAENDEYQNDAIHIIYRHDSNSNLGFCGTTKSWHNAIQYNHKENFPIQRMKRSNSSQEEYYLEVAVVVDKKFIEFHRNKPDNNDDVEEYILTIMNMVSDYYQDESLGHLIEISISRIIYLEEMNRMEIDISQNAVKTLKSFCVWQKEQNPNKQLHDIAILLTRENICMDGRCDLLGLANVAAACISKSSCAINEDTGLALGVTVTHEIGHLLGAYHDDDKKCSSVDENNFHSVMAPSVSLSTGKWSQCSRDYINNLFENRLGDCLKNSPKESFHKLDSSLPGNTYDATYQCRILFGSNATLCDFDKLEICKKLFCRIGNKCVSNTEAPADGTPCGADKWCINHECVKIGIKNQHSIDGGWSQWSEFSKCNRDCGGGVQISSRKCNNPRPKNRGNHCDGIDMKFKICNTNPCKDDIKKSFRDQQCQKFNEFNLNWTSLIVNEDICGLYCINKKGERKKFAEIVENGTPCRAGSNDMCIDGNCEHVGCDWKFNSNSVEDKCGDCGGDGTTCDIINGTIVFNSGESDDKSVILPKGARNVIIKKLSSSPSLIQLMMNVENSSSKEHLMSYKADDDEIAIIEMPERNKEEIFIKGPLKHELAMHVKHRDKNSVKIYYEYAVMKHRERNNNSKWNSETESINVDDMFSWNYIQSNGRKCTTRCGGGGIQEIPAICMSSRNGMMSDEFCSKTPKPPSKFRYCNTHSCAYKWQTSDWLKCNGCIQMRTVQCGHESREWNVKPIHVDDIKCLNTSKPSTKRLCLENPQCTRKCKGNRSMRSIDDKKSDGNEDNVKYTECLDVLILNESPDINDALMYDDVDEEAEIEISPGSDEKLSSFATETLPFQYNHDGKSKQSQPTFFIIHPLMMRHPLVNHHREHSKIPRRIERHVVIDKIPKQQTFLQEIPIVKHQQHKVNDEVYRKLGDKIVEEMLDVEHASEIPNPETRKATGKSG